MYHFTPAKGGRMKNKDTKDLVMKDFEAYPDVAADLLNVFLHEGQQ